MPRVCRIGVGTLTAVTALSLAAASAQTSAPGRSTVTVFSDATVLPMTQPASLQRHTVIVRDGRIAEIGPAGRVRIPEGAIVIDGRGRYLIPGLVDTHVHLHRESDLLLYLANGVTTVRNMKGEPKHLVWRERLSSDQMVGPNLLTTGPFIEGVSSAADAERTAREHFEAGYDFLKIHGDLSLAAYRRLVAVSQQLRIPLVGHLPRNLPLDSTLVSPQTSIDHAEEYVYTFFGNRVGDTTRVADAAERTRAARIAVAPTLISYQHIAHQLDSLPDLLAQSEARFLPPIERIRWRPENNYYSRNIPPTAARGFRASLRFQQALVRALHRASVPLMLGTDAGGPETLVPGFSALDELDLLVESGLAPYEALRSATAAPAEVWQKSREFGVIAVGARADLLLLEADPLADIRNVRRRAGVMVRGLWMPETVLAERLQQTAAKYHADQLLMDSLAQAGIADATTRRLSASYQRLDRDAQLLVDYHIAELYRAALEQGGVSGLEAAFRRAAASADAVTPFPQAALTDLGYRYLWTKQPSDAVAVLRMVAKAYPDEYGAHSALGEALLIAGDTTAARAALERSLQLKPGNPLAASLLRQLAPPLR